MPELHLHAYDVYDAASNLIGGVVLSKMYGYERGKPVALLTIQSIASSTSRCGTGTIVLDVCEQVLFADLPKECATGYIFAQCVKVGFWQDRLDGTRLAKALVYQMALITDKYPVYKHCQYKSQRFKRHADV